MGQRKNTNQFALLFESLDCVVKDMEWGIRDRITKCEKRIR